MAFAPLALGAVGALTSAVGSIAGGEATANAADYNAQVAQNNATIAKQNATYAIDAGEADVEKQGLKGAAAGGELKASQAANGIDVNKGSAVDVQVGQREQSNLDAQTLLNNSELKAYGYESAATGFTAQAGLDKEEAETAPIGADIGAAGGLLGSASSLSFKWAGNGGGNSGGSFPTVAQDQP